MYDNEPLSAFEFKAAEQLVREAKPRFCRNNQLACARAMIKELRGVLQRLHYPLEVMLVCVRWYAAYPLSLRHIEEMMAERGVRVDHATIHRWALKILPVLAKAFRRKRPANPP